MIKNQGLFERLVSEASQQPFSGWDFAYLTNRWTEAQVSWNYRQTLSEKIRSINFLLDMGTGGGEFLATLQPLPPHTYATESYAPNVPLAKARLEPLGVKVVQIYSNDNLPFEDNYFDVVINQHEAYSATEVYRILKTGGSFITQQVGGTNNYDLNKLLQDQPEFEYAYWTLDYAVQELQQAGFQIMEQKEEFPETVIADVGAIVYSLKANPWQISGFSVEKYYDKLVAIHNNIQETGSLIMKSHRFLIKVVKP